MLCASITILLWAQYKYHLYYWRVKLLHISLPIFAGIMNIFVQHQYYRKHLKECERITAGRYFFVAEILQTITILNLVLLPIVQQRTSGIKEILSISSRHSNWNLIIFFVLQVLINFGIFGLIFLVAWSLSISEHFEMKYLALLVFLYTVANISFTFAISVMFKTGENMQ